MELLALIIAGLCWWWATRLWENPGNGPAGRHGAGLLAFAVVAVLMLQADGSTGASEVSERDGLRTGTPLPSGRLPSVATSPASVFPPGPVSTQSPMWQFIVNNALRTADDYASARDARAVFVGPGVSTEFLKQLGGEHEGRYLLKVLNHHGDDTSLAMLLPLFDEYSHTDDLDDEAELWQVVVAKFNGRNF